MSRRQELAELIHDRRCAQQAEIAAAHAAHHARIDAGAHVGRAVEKASTEEFHADKARIRVQFAKVIDPLVAEHDSLLADEKATATGAP